MIHIKLTPGKMTLAQMRQVFETPVQVSLPDSANAAIQRSVDCVNQVLDEDRTVYGINTGFGLLAQTRIEKDHLEELQRSLVLSHATGVGEPMDGSAGFSARRWFRRDAKASQGTGNAVRGALGAALRVAFQDLWRAS